MKKRGVTLADVRTDSASFRAANPHLFGGAPAVKAPERALGGDSKPVSPSKRVRTAPKPKTKPEIERNLILGAEQRRGEIESFEFEGITLSIGDGTRYTPDFAVWLHSGKLRFVEVKGPWWEEDALIKWKVAKGKYRHCEFEFWSRQKDGWTRIA